jgi:magnesium chelatase accessory protein
MANLDFECDGRDWPNREHSRFIDAVGFQWHVQMFGAGPPMLLLHGTGASTHSWRGLAPLLASRFTLVMPDLPGHGFTKMPPVNAYTLPGMAAAVGELMAAMSVRPEIVVGHSAGAAVLIRMTLDRLINPSAIVSLNGALLPFDGFAGQFFSPLAKLLFLNPFMPRVFAWRASEPKAVENLLRGTGSEVSREDVAYYGRLFRSPGHCAAALAMMARWDLPPLVRDLPKLTTRLVLVAALHDKAIPPVIAARVSTLVPNGRVIDVPGAGHLAHEERPDAVAEIIFRAAADVPASAPQ